MSEIFNCEILPRHLPTLARCQPSGMPDGLSQPKLGPEDHGPGLCGLIEGIRLSGMQCLPSRLPPSPQHKHSGRGTKEVDVKYKPPAVHSVCGRVGGQPEE